MSRISLQRNLLQAGCLESHHPAIVAGRISAPTALTPRFVVRLDGMVHASAVQVAVWVLWTLLFFVVNVRALNCAQDSGTKMNTNIDANQLVREAIQNGFRVPREAQTHWRYRELSQNDGKEELREVIETNEGDISRLLAINNEPLPPNQDQLENSRIQKLTAHPEQVRKEQVKQDEDSKKERQLLQSFPRAFIYRYAGMERGFAKIEFTPNPDFRASTREEQVFDHMKGVIWIDNRQKHVAGIEGTLTSEVKFGAGLLGHLEKGGTFSVRWTDLGKGDWEMESLDVHMKGKALFFKTISVQQKERCTNYEPVPAGMTLQKAAQQLLQHGSNTLAETHLPKSRAN